MARKVDGVVERSRNRSMINHLPRWVKYTFYIIIIWRRDGFQVDLGAQPLHWLKIALSGQGNSQSGDTARTINSAIRTCTIADGRARTSYNDPQAARRVGGPPEGSPRLLFDRLGRVNRSMSNGASMRV